MLLIKLRKFHSLTHQHILPTGNEKSEDWNKLCTSFHTCSKRIPQVSSYVVIDKQKYCIVIVKKKYRHLYFPFPKHKEIRVWRCNFITLTQGMKVPLLKLSKKEKCMSNEKTLIVGTKKKKRGWRRRTRYFSVH